MIGPPQIETQLRIRVVFDAGRYFGPGKAVLLEGIARTGSLAAAGRDMGMSYKRAWDLVREMNAMFASPLVALSRGGAGGGGARLTGDGEKVLALYQQLCHSARQSGSAALSEMATMLHSGAP